ncbi:hypothetical protein CYMTET_9664, partial [Cymbomonas tetramitiformis]
MWSRFSRLSRRNKALIGVATGAASVCAYSAVQRLVEYYRESERVVAQYQDQRRIFEEKQADENVRNHFNSIQKISDNTTMPSILPHIRDRLFKLIDISDLTGRLMRAKTSEEPLSATEKYGLWEELKILSFTRTCTAAIAVSLLDLFLRVQLNIVGRYLYLDSALEIQQDIGPALSKECQGIEILLELVRQSVEEVLNGSVPRLTAPLCSACCFGFADYVQTPLNSRFTQEQLQHLLTQMHDTFWSKTTQSSWRELLLPDEVERVRWRPAKYHPTNEVERVRWRPAKYHPSNEVERVRWRPAKYHPSNEVERVRWRPA